MLEASRSDFGRKSAHYPLSATRKENKMKKFDSLVKVVASLNSFNLFGSSKTTCLPFVIDNKQVGFIRPDIWRHLRHYDGVFHVTTTNNVDSVILSPDLQTPDARTVKVKEILEDLRLKGVLKSLNGWRDEDYDVWDELSQSPIMRMERSATCLFGVKQCGVHINGYTEHPELGLSMWIAKRSATKQTWPGMFDQMAAGGLTAGMSKMACARKECQEEASVPEHLLDNLKFVGCISYAYEDERGIFPECQYVLDLMLPPEFEPVNSDGEAESFQLVPVHQIRELIMGSNFKPNCALCVVDFLVRHGFVTPDTEPDYFEIVRGMHNPL